MDPTQFASIAKIANLTNMLKLSLNSYCKWLTVADILLSLYDLPKVKTVASTRSVAHGLAAVVHRD